MNILYSEHCIYFTLVQGIGVVGGRKLLGTHAGKTSLNLQHRESEVHDGAHVQDVVPCFILHHLSKREVISMLANNKDNTIDTINTIILNIENNTRISLRYCDNGSTTKSS